MKSRVMNHSKTRDLAKLITLVGAKKQILALPQKLRDADDLFMPVMDELIKQAKNVPWVYSKTVNATENARRFDPKGEDARHTAASVLLSLGMPGWHTYQHEDTPLTPERLVFDADEIDKDAPINHTEFRLEIYEVPTGQRKKNGREITEHRNYKDIQLLSKWSINMMSDHCWGSSVVVVNYLPMMDEFIKAKDKALEEMDILEGRLDRLIRELESNINKMRTTKKVIENWPEVEPLVLKMYGEEDSKSSPEVPLGNIINRHLLQITDQSEVAA